ncbi:MAG TPA: hypothetical protein GX528_02250 [Firmicutes bacterium]|nr:hypothetical protein [Bacillota bacterium]
MHIKRDGKPPLFYISGEGETVRGKVRLGKRTKELAPKLQPKEIAVIRHEDLDAVGAAGLIDAGIKAVINARSSLTCRYPNLGPQLLLEQEILHLDNVGDEIFASVQNGDEIEIRGRRIIKGGEVVGVGRIVTGHVVKESRRLSLLNLSAELDRFVTNTLTYAAKEKEVILGDLFFPPLPLKMQGKPVVVVVRGFGYKEDLRILSSFIQEAQPILIGVDGGADALLACGYEPHLIVGDMDSVTDSALLSKAILIAHAYQNGECPSAPRLDALGLTYHKVSIPGTSEDLALLLAHDKQAQLIVLVGSHSNMIDFLEKGRPGMASTFLTRLKIGPILLDAKKVSELHRGGTVFSVVPIVVAALIPILVFIALASPWRHYFRLLWLQLRLIVGGS